MPPPFLPFTIIIFYKTERIYLKTKETKGKGVRTHGMVTTTSEWYITR